jgi:hypothetical protein
MNSTNMTFCISIETIEKSKISIINDFIQSFILPAICGFGIITNIIDCIVLSSDELKDDIFKYLKMNAFSKIFYLSICMFLFFARCGQYCNLSDAFSVQLYYWLFYTYLKGIPAIYTVCVQIIVSLLRLNIVSSHKIIKLPDYKKISIVLLLFSALFYSPNLFTKKIFSAKCLLYSEKNETKIHYSYSTINNSIGDSILGKCLIIITQIIRGYIAAIIIIIINLITKIRLNDHFVKRINIKQKNITEKPTGEYLTSFILIQNLREIRYFNKIYF